MDFWDVSLLPSRATFYTTFLNNCGGGECLRTTAYPRTVVVGKQWHAPCKILLLQQRLFLVSIEFHGDHKTVTRMR